MPPNDPTPHPALRAPEVIVIPAGDFLMGGVPEDKFVTAVELPRHRVTIHRPFALGRALLTRGEWRALMGPLPSGCEEIPADDDCPVVNVTLADALAYLRELSAVTGIPHRLPTEAEWEYACRAGSSTVFPHGSTLGDRDANFLYDERGEAIGTGHLTPAGQFPPNAFGIHDLLGNACEWTADTWHPGYHGAPADGSAWTDDGKPGCHTIRGGGWDHLPRVLRASWRDWAPGSARWDNLGFRVARTL